MLHIRKSGKLWQPWLKRIYKRDIALPAILAFALLLLLIPAFVNTIVPQESETENLDIENAKNGTLNIELGSFNHEQCRISMRVAFKSGTETETELDKGIVIYSEPGNSEQSLIGNDSISARLGRDFSNKSGWYLYPPSPWLGYDSFATNGSVSDLTIHLYGNQRHFPFDSYQAEVIWIITPENQTDPLPVALHVNYASSVYEVRIEKLESADGFSAWLITVQSPIAYPVSFILIFVAFTALGILLFHFGKKANESHHAAILIGFATLIIAVPSIRQLLRPITIEGFTACDLLLLIAIIIMLYLFILLAWGWSVLRGNGNVRD
jgi:hypothetical protein